MTNEGEENKATERTHNETVTTIEDESMKEKSDATTTTTNTSTSSSSSTEQQHEEQLKKSLEIQSNTATTPSTSTSTSTIDNNNNNNNEIMKKQPRRIIRRKGGGGSNRRRRNNNNKKVTLDIQFVEQTLKESNLPIQSYSFEIIKTVEKIITLQITHVALQLPEGLLLYATVLGDVLKRLTAPYLFNNNSSTTTTTTTTTDGNNNNNNNNNNKNNNKNMKKELQVSILGDVTYGACCIDDIGASALGAQLLVHYGHSCLVPIQHTIIPCLYVFVELTIDIKHFVDCLQLTIQQDLLQQQKQSNDTISNKAVSITIYLLGTIQFRHCLLQAQELTLQQQQQEEDQQSSSTTNYNVIYNVIIPQVKPLSPGEVLGCTSPTLPTTSKNEKVYCCFVADGRFHLESTLINNPQLQYLFRYDPYSKTMTKESYGHEQMKKIRRNAILQTIQTIIGGGGGGKKDVVEEDKNNNKDGGGVVITTTKKHVDPTTTTTTTNNNNKNDDNVIVFGIILGTLGRQGNPAIVQQIQNEIINLNTHLNNNNNNSSKRGGTRRIKSFILLLSEITPLKLSLFESKINIWVQVACPRLSVDWGHFLSANSKPVLNSYEFHTCISILKNTYNNNNNKNTNNNTEYEYYTNIVSNLWTKKKKRMDNNNNNNNNNNNHNETKEDEEIERYPMDFYSNASNGPWGNYHEQTKHRQYRI